jgi:hypothetical protein
MHIIHKLFLTDIATSLWIGIARRTYEATMGCITDDIYMHLECQETQCKSDLFSKLYGIMNDARMNVVITLVAHVHIRSYFWMPTTNWLAVD